MCVRFEVIEYVKYVYISEIKYGSSYGRVMQCTAICYEERFCGYNYKIIHD